MKARLPALLGCASVLATASLAHALDVGLDVSACENLSSARVRELTELELKTRVVPAQAAPLAASVAVTCAGDEVTIRVSDATTNKVVTRTFTLQQSDADVRARAVSLAAAELVLTSWMELMLSEGGEREAPASPRVAEDRRAASALVRRRTGRAAHVAALLAFAESGGTFRAAPWTAGGGLRLAITFAEPRFGLDTDFSMTTASQSTTLGDVRTNTWSLSVRPSFCFTGSALFASAGVGARAGLARIEGHAVDPSAARGRVVAGAWAGPLAHANIGFSLHHVAAVLGAEAGYALRGVSGSVDSSDRAGVRAAWFFLSLGLGWAPG